MSRGPMSAKERIWLGVFLMVAGSLGVYDLATHDVVRVKTVIGTPLVLVLGLVMTVWGVIQALRG
jgi:hypothetical protein